MPKKRKTAPKRMPRTCPCPSTLAREAFKKATTCSAKSRAFDAVKSLAAKDAELMKPGQRSLVFRDLLKKQQQVQDLCAREEASDAARFNGLGRYGRRRRRRR